MGNDLRIAFEPTKMATMTIPTSDVVLERHLEYLDQLQVPHSQERILQLTGKLRLGGRDDDNNLLDLLHQRLRTAEAATTTNNNNNSNHRQTTTRLPSYDCSRPECSANPRSRVRSRSGSQGSGRRLPSSSLVVGTAFARHHRGRGCLLRRESSSNIECN